MVATAFSRFATTYKSALSKALTITDEGNRSGHCTMPFVFIQAAESARMSITVERSSWPARRIVTPAGSCPATETAWHKGRSGRRHNREKHRLEVVLGGPAHDDRMCTDGPARVLRQRMRCAEGVRGV